MGKLFTEFMTGHKWLIGPMLIACCLFMFGLLAMLILDVSAKLMTARREWVDWKDRRTRDSSAIGEDGNA